MRFVFHDCFLNSCVKIVHISLHNTLHITLDKPRRMVASYFIFPLSISFNSNRFRSHVHQSSCDRLQFRVFKKRRVNRAVSEKRFRLSRDPSTPYSARGLNFPQEGAYIDARLNDASHVPSISQQRTDLSDFIRDSLCARARNICTGAL